MEKKKIEEISFGFVFGITVFLLSDPGLCLFIPQDGKGRYGRATFEAQLGTCCQVTEQQILFRGSWAERHPVNSW